MKRTAAAILALLMALGLCSCGGQRAESCDFFAMDTSMRLMLYGDDAALFEDTQAEIGRIENAFSRTIDTSLVSRLNRGETVTDAELADLLTSCITYTDLTDGAFDVTIAPVVLAWGFTTEHHRVPDAETLQELLQSVGRAHLHLSANDPKVSSSVDTVALDKGSSIDLGGVAKGYASDRVAALWKEQGVKSGLAALGGNIYCCGCKPDGSKWNIAVRDPFDGSAYIGTLALEDAFAVTSGGYERYFEENGKIYHHIIDPATGYPAESGLASVTIVSDSGSVCDILSTACYVLGAERAEAVWRSIGGFEMVIVTDDGHILITEGLEKDFDASSAAHDYDYEILR